MGSSRSDGSSKERLKWTQELHNLFEKAVTQLGGPERATPKGILKVMGIPGLTIFHVKSHLQKYRMSKFVPEDPVRGKYERRSISEILPNFSATSGAQLNEALQMQMEVHRRLSDHIEVQRSLKMKMEAQGRFLEKIMEEQRIAANNNKPYPSLCEDSETNLKDIESDSEVIDNNNNNIGIMPNSNEFFPPRKRVRLDEDDEATIMSQTQRYYNYNFPYYQGPLSNFPFSSSPSPMEMSNISWSTLATTSFQSPTLLPAMYDSLN